MAGPEDCYDIEEQRMRQNFESLGLPDYMFGGTWRWINNGIQPGSFLQAVVNNDLHGALCHADDHNINKLKEWMHFFQHVAPSGCWGDRTIARMWRDSGGLQGKTRQKREPHRTTAPGIRHRS